jgi:predicted adenine nucleotide alpha hydrolase (AANH) superfamily ATPase
MLKDEYDVSFYWHNPNIYDELEHDNRKQSAIKYAKELNILFCEEKHSPYNYEAWKNKTFEKCELCYAIRLEITAIFAKQNNFNFFSTSLLASPHQKHNLIKQTAENLSDKYKINFLYKDFRTKYYECKNSLRQKGYYMQKYCACNKSYEERLQRNV